VLSSSSRRRPDVSGLFEPPLRPHPRMPTGQTRLRFVDCLAWMVNSLTENHHPHANGAIEQHPDDNDDDKPMVWWSPDGQALYFRLDEQYKEQLSAVIRPFFKHGNFGSIRRQLFAYGFSKPLQGPYVFVFISYHTPSVQIEHQQQQQRDTHYSHYYYYYYYSFFFLFDSILTLLSTETRRALRIRTLNAAS
jgi:HSF-type DNA-binding